MAIQLHNFLSIGKRYIQVETQPHHITGIVRSILKSCQNSDEIQLCKAVDSAYFECPEDGTITFYQTAKFDLVNSGIYTYVVYQYLEDEEKVFRDFSIDTSTNLLHELLAGQKISFMAANIQEYLKYKFYENEYIKIFLPKAWNNLVGKEIADLLLEEYQAIQTSFLFSEEIGKKYIKNVFNEFIQAGWDILENGGKSQEFEVIQYNILKNTTINEIANLIIEYNDYRVWQEDLPSKSKAIEYAFQAALNLICRIK